MAATFKLDTYIADVLLRDLVSHDRSPAAFMVYFFLAARAGRARGGISMSLAELADRTGLSKRAVQLALSHLRRRHLIRTAQAHRTAVPTHVVVRPWRSR
jgi:DNA-binding GntR family transcriptional regulator